MPANIQRIAWEYVARCTVRQCEPRRAREAGITEQTSYRWRKEFGGLKLEQAKRLKELERVAAWVASAQLS